MSNPLVSVIIPVNNKGFFLKNSIDSVLNQTFQDFEIIIIDNNHLNNTKQVVETCEDSRINYFYREGVGLSAARNFGIEKSRGKYIALLGPDDIWDASKLEKQLAIFSKKADVGLVYCGTLLIDKNNSPAGQKPIVTYKGKVFSKMVVHNFLYNCSVPLFRKECLEKTGMFDETIDKMTDWEFYLRFAINYKFWPVQERLVKARFIEKAKGNDFEFFETSGFKILNKIFQRTDIDICHLRHINSAYAMRYRYIAKKYFEKECFDKSKGYFQEALKRDFLTSCRSDIPLYYLLCCLPKVRGRILKNSKKKQEKSAN